MSNSYRKIEIGNHKYLLITFDYVVKEATLDWANKLISEHPDYKVILSMHSYLNEDGNLLTTETNTSSSVKDLQGDTIWEKVVSKHKNIFMVFCGHIRIDEDPIVQTRKGDNGNDVIEILVNPQQYDWNVEPGGFIMMLNFMDGGSKLEIEYYSAVKDKYFKEKNQISMTLPEGTLPKYIAPVVATSATTEPATEAPATDAPAEEEKSGCGSAISSTLAVACALGTTLSAFAMRKNKEN